MCPSQPPSACVLVGYSAMQILLGLALWTAAEAWAPAQPLHRAVRSQGSRWDGAEVSVGPRAREQRTRLDALGDDDDDEDGASQRVTSFADADDFQAGTSAVGEGELTIVKFW